MQGIWVDKFIYSFGDSNDKVDPREVNIYVDNKIQPILIAPNGTVVQMVVYEFWSHAIYLYML